MRVEGCPKSEEKRAAVEGFQHKSLVGSLIYLAICTWLDLAMGVSIVSRFGHNPGMVHWEAAKRLLRYVKDSDGDGIFNNLGENVELWVYSDASYGSDSETKRGRSRFVTMSGRAAISWGS